MLFNVNMVNSSYTWYIKVKIHWHCCSVTQSCLTVGDPMDNSLPGSPVLQHLPEFAQTHIHGVNGPTIHGVHGVNHPTILSSLIPYNIKNLYMFPIEIYIAFSPRGPTVNPISFIPSPPGFSMPWRYPISVRNAMSATKELPWWLTGKESACQWRRQEFNPWSGKIFWRRKWQPTPVFLQLQKQFHQNKNLKNKIET